MDKDKKLRAAIAGVLNLLSEEAHTKKQKNRWVQEGRKLMMQNQVLVQRKEMSWK